MKDYYYLLGIEYAATRAEIGEAYRKLASKFHPDKNQDDPFFERRFKEINEAYQVLSDREKRSLYDMTWRSMHQDQGAILSVSQKAVKGQQIDSEEILPEDLFGTIKNELYAAVRERWIMFLIGIVFLLISSIQLGMHGSLSGLRLVVDGLLILFMSAAFSGSMVIMIGFFKGSNERFSRVLLRNMPIYLIIICLFRMVTG